MMSKDFSVFAKTLADASGDIIRQYFRSGIGVDDKADGSPVTIADRKAEETMRELIMREFPEHGIQGEEFGLHQPDAEYKWVLDPIDGTKNFITGSFLFGTLIALLHKGKPILGVINHPITHQFLLGAEGVTSLNGRLVKVRGCNRVEDATILSSGHYYVEQYADMRAYEAFTRRAKLYYTWGDCHGYYLLATGYADVMLDPIMSPWDLLALIPIIEGAGGKITDWHGGDAAIGTSIIATSGTIHSEVVRALNPRY